MYRVFLVDDRVDVVEGIMALVPWESFGCVAVGSATNGTQNSRILSSRISRCL